MRKVTKIFWFFLIAGLSSTQMLTAQEVFDFAAAEKHLNSLHDSLTLSRNQHVRYHANTLFQQAFDSLLQQNLDTKLPLQHLKISQLSASDNKLHLFTWMLPRDDGGMEYFGRVLTYDARAKKWRAQTLVDKSADLFELETLILSPERWFGAHYSERIEQTLNGTSYYTLLGWNGRNPNLNRKVIEIMTVKANGQIQFGADLFRWNRERLKRKIFTYSRRASMILHYDIQNYKEIVRPAQRATSDRKAIPAKEKWIKAPMIVFDQLIPPQPELKGSFQFYVPCENVSALVWLDKRWTFKQDILAVNKQPSKQPTKKPAKRPRN